MSRRGSLWVGLAIALAIAAAFSALMGGGGDSARILIATQPLDAGEDIETAVLEERAAFRDLAGAHMLSGVVGDLEEVSGARLAAVVQEGEPITYAALGGLDAPLPEVGPSERLLSVPLVSVGAAAGAVGSGVEVDVVASVVDGPVVVARVIAERALVVSVEDGADAVERGAAGVLIRVTDREALVVTEALATAQDLRLIVRPPGVESRP